MNKVTNSTKRNLQGKKKIISKNNIDQKKYLSFKNMIDGPTYHSVAFWLLGLSRFESVFSAPKRLGCLLGTTIMIGESWGITC